jgi:hypothetical protein
MLKQANMKKSGGLDSGSGEQVVWPLRMWRKSKFCASGWKDAVD